MQALSRPAGLVLMFALALTGACDKQPDDETTANPETSETSGDTSSTGGASSGSSSGATTGANTSTSTSATTTTGTSSTSSSTSSTGAPMTTDDSDPSGSDSGEKLDLAGGTDGTSSGGNETVDPPKFDIGAP